ncbi:MAG: hypothetical protein ACR2GA_04080 [Chloroflexota bacterium]
MPQTYAAMICQKSRHFTCKRFVKAAPAVKRAALEPDPNEVVPTDEIVETVPRERNRAVAATAPSTAAAPKSARTESTPAAPQRPIDAAVPIGATADPEPPVSPVESPAKQPPREGARRIFPLWWMVLVGVLIVGFEAVLLLQQNDTRPRSAAPVSKALGAPTGLIARQIGAGRFILSWAPLRGATSYRVQIGKHRFSTVVDYTLSSRLVFNRTFRPETRHVWTVQGRHGSRSGVLSHPAMFTVLPLPARVWSFNAVKTAHTASLLLLYNPNRSEVTVGVTAPGGLGGGFTLVHIPAHTAARVALGAPAGQAIGFAATVQAEAPLFAQRIIVGQGVSSATYGMPST